MEIREDIHPFYVWVHSRKGTSHPVISLNQRRALFLFQLLAQVAEIGAHVDLGAAAGGTAAAATAGGAAAAVALPAAVRLVAAAVLLFLGRQRCGQIFQA